MNSQLGDSVNQPAGNSSIESYTWNNLVYRGRYQFIVVAFTSRGPGEAANLTFNTSGDKLLVTTSLVAKVEVTFIVTRKWNTHILIKNKCNL